MRRRDVLRTCGSVLATITLAGCSGGEEPATMTTSKTTTQTPTSRTTTQTPTSTPTEECSTTELTPTVSGATEGGLGAKIADHGHYAWFPLSSGSWARQPTPYDIRRPHPIADGCSRWMATPTKTGSIRCLVENIDVSQTPQSAGFDLHLGRLGDIEEIRITSNVVQSGKHYTNLAVALYLDENGNGDFFEWEPTNTEKEAYAGLGGDEEGVLTNSAGDQIIINDETNFYLLNRRSAAATMGMLKNGEINHRGDDDGRRSGKDRGIDDDTNAAIYVGLVDTGDGNPVEAVVEDVTVERS